MTKSIYIAGAESQVGKSAIAVAIIDSLLEDDITVAIYRPLIVAGTPDQMLINLLREYDTDQEYESGIGVTYDQMAAEPGASLAKIVAGFGVLRKRYDAVVVIGSDFTDVSDPIEFSLNARLAANLDAAAVVVVSGRNKTPEQLRRSAQYAMNEFIQHHVHVLGVVASRIDPPQFSDAEAALANLRVPVVALLPENRLLAAPTVRAQFEAVQAKVWRGGDTLDVESLGVVVSGMNLVNLLDRIPGEHTLVMASDRMDLLPGVLLAQTSENYEKLAALVLVGGYGIPPAIESLLQGLDLKLPIGITQLDSFATASILSRVEGTVTSSYRKICEARAEMAAHLDTKALLRALDAPRKQLRTHNLFEYEIMEQAGEDLMNIVLPEAEDRRILEATAALLEREAANIILLGNADQIRAHAAELGLNIDKATIVPLDEPETLQRYAEEYARLRAHKGVTLEQAFGKMTDPSYFGTMMVHFGDADAMVSGATHTTANTIRPALEFIKTRPGVKVVSGAYFMCMPDQVLVFADCAVNPNPTASELADIAISSADTAHAFGIEPLVAMLSYSTGTSGTGPDVDLVREATGLVQQRRPDIPVAGPIQFDAAIDPTVGKLKMPGSPVAGRATVFVFPDLNAGNACYKAVQRTAGAVAVGPVLQGLNNPITDLSRGAMVEDIVSTVAITAIQAQAKRAEIAAATHQPV